MPDAADFTPARLRQQLIQPTAKHSAIDSADVVAHLGALQAQDYAGALWSVGLRARQGTTAADVERSIADRRIVRTWAMRGTLHFVRPEDVRWLLAMLGERVLGRAKRRHEQLGLTEAHFGEALTLLTDALSGGQCRSRADLMALLAANGISPIGQRGYHILWALALRGLLCCGPMAGTQTFVLLDEWIPRDGTPLPGRPEALAMLANRYFTARGPATVADFAWWAGITLGDARAGSAATADGLSRVSISDIEYFFAHGAKNERSSPRSTAAVWLLPGFDEYLIGYKDRATQLGKHLATYGSTVSPNGVFTPTVVIDGGVAGTWRRTVKHNRVEIAIRPFRALTAIEHAELAREADRYGRFLGMTAVLIG